MPPVIELLDLHRVYPAAGTPVHALRGLTFRIERGEFVAIMGSSGSGKSTLLNLLGCLDRPTGGVYRLDGVDTATLSPDDLAALRNRHIGFVFQGFNLLPRTSALENVILPLLYSNPPHAFAEIRGLAEKVLRRVGLADRLDHVPAELSGGQQQRVAIARALVGSPSLLLADEPTGNLDTATGREIMGLFRELHAEGGTIVLVTHEPAIAGQAARVIRLNDGLVVYDTAAARV